MGKWMDLSIFTIPDIIYNDPICTIVYVANRLQFIYLFIFLSEIGKIHSSFCRYLHTSIWEKMITSVRAWEIRFCIDCIEIDEWQRTPRAEYFVKHIVIRLSIVNWLRWRCVDIDTHPQDTREISHVFRRITTANIESLQSIVCPYVLVSFNRIVFQWKFSAMYNCTIVHVSVANYFTRNKPTTKRNKILSQN